MKKAKKNVSTLFTNMLIFEKNAKIIETIEFNSPKLLKQLNSIAQNQGRHQGYTASPPVRGPGPQGGPEGPGLCVNVGLGGPDP